MGKQWQFISVLNELKLNFAVAIRSNHGVWLPPGQTVRYNKWRKFTRIFSDGTDEIRYIRKSFWQASCHSILANYN
jgi:SRSO17 transposase